MAANVREAETTSTTARKAEQNEARLRSDYDRYLGHAVERLGQSLPAAEIVEVDSMARAKMRPSRGGTGFLANALFAMERASLLAGRYPGKVLSFDQWKGSRPEQGGGFDRKNRGV